MLVAVFVIVAAQMVLTPRLRMERFTDYTETKDPGLGTPTEPEIADFRQPLPLADFLKVNSGLNTLTVQDCASLDAARITELGGSYLQRTNNYRHTYPDVCEVRPNEFVASVYQPREAAIGEAAIGAGVACAGGC